MNPWKAHGRVQQTEGWHRKSSLLLLLHWPTVVLTNQREETSQSAPRTPRIKGTASAWNSTVSNNCSPSSYAVALPCRSIDWREPITRPCCGPCLCVSRLWPAEAQIVLDGPRSQLLLRWNRDLRTPEARGSSLAWGPAYLAGHHTSPGQASPESSHHLSY